MKRSVFQIISYATSFYLPVYKKLQPFFNAQYGTVLTFYLRHLNLWMETSRLTFLFEMFMDDIFTYSVSALWRKWQMALVIQYSKRIKLVLWIKCFSCMGGFVNV